MVGSRAGLCAFAAVGAAACGLAVNGLGPPDDGALDASPGLDVSADGATPTNDGPTAQQDGGVGATSDAIADAGGAETVGHDAPGLDAPVGGGPSLCATANVLFCEGFENGLGVWTAVANGGHSNPDKTRPYRGASSLHATIDAIKQPGTPVNAKQEHFQQLPADVFVRVFVYVPSPFPASSPDLVEVTVDSNPYPGMELLERAPGVVAASAFGGPTDDWASATPVPLDQWACFEIEVDGPNQTFRAWLDDVPLGDMTRTFSQPVSAAGIVKVGLAYFAPATNQPATEVWVDEVAVDGARIGCAK